MPALSLLQLAPPTRDPVALPDGVAYPVRDLSVAGGELLDRWQHFVSTDPEAAVAAVVTEAQNVTGAPLEVVRRCSVRELLLLLFHAADRLRDVKALLDAREAAAPGEAAAPATSEGQTPAPIEWRVTMDATGSASP